MNRNNTNNIGDKNTKQIIDITPLLPPISLVAANVLSADPERIYLWSSVTVIEVVINE